MFLTALYREHIKKDTFFPTGKKVYTQTKQTINNPHGQFSSVKEAFTLFYSYSYNYPF